MLSKEYIIVIVCSIVALILIILYFTKDKWYKSKILNKQSNDLSNPPNEPKISVLDLTPYAMEQSLEKNCVTINQEDAVSQLSKQYMDMIQDRNFLRDKRLMEMARYSRSSPSQEQNPFGESSLLSLTPYAMEQKLKENCITLKESEANFSKINESFHKIRKICMRNEMFSSNGYLMKMAEYSPYIIEEALCLKGKYTFKEFMATGNGGAVITITNNSNGTDYVVKLLEYDIGFVYEVQSAYKFMQLGIGVNIYQACRVNLELKEQLWYTHSTTKQRISYGRKIFPIGILVMEKVSNRLTDIFDYNEDMQRQLAEAKQNILQVEQNIAQLKASKIDTDELKLELEEALAYKQNQASVQYDVENYINNDINRIIPQILNAFQIMEENQCCHWDLHCGNIGFNNENNLRIFDFGMSSVLQYYEDMTALSFAKGNMPDGNEDNIIMTALWERLKHKIIPMTGSINSNNSDIRQRARLLESTYNDMLSQYKEKWQDTYDREIWDRTNKYNDECHLARVKPPDHTQEWDNILNRAMSEVNERYKTRTRRHFGTF